MIKSTNQKAVRTEQQVVWRTDNRSVKNAVNKNDRDDSDDSDDPDQTDGVQSIDEKFLAIFAIHSDHVINESSVKCHIVTLLSHWHNDKLLLLILYINKFIIINKMK